jgi:hypothetical protein
VSFHPFKVVSKAAGGGQTGVSASLKSLRGAPAKLSFAITAEKARELGWVDGDMLEVLIGQDEHHGLVRLRKNHSVGTARVSRRKAMNDTTWFHVALGHVPAFVARSEPKKHCQNEVLDAAAGGWLEIVLPSWADETGKVKRAPVASSPVTTSARTGRDAAPRMMGDPPKGRSALDQQRS